MKKRITIVMLCLVMVAALACGTQAVHAASATITVKADKTEAEPGDTINFSIILGPVSELGAMQMMIIIPEGLSYSEGSGKLADGLMDTLGFDLADFTEETLMITGVASKADYACDDNTLLATFQCTVDEGFKGTAETDLTDLVFYSVKTRTDHTSEYFVKAAVVTVAGQTEPSQDPNTNAGEITPPAEDPNAGETTPPADDPNAGENNSPAENTDPGKNTEPENGPEGTETPSDGSDTNEADDSTSTDKNGSEGQNKGSEGNAAPSENASPNGETASSDNEPTKHNTTPNGSAADNIVPDKGDRQNNDQVSFPWWIAGAVVAIAVIVLLLARKRNAK